ncbi:MAG: ECF transporter S component [archaeon]|nr:ECF transporter S component [Candidatus Bathyarchaeum sp.]
MENKQTLQASSLKTTTVDLVTISLLAGLGLATKSVLRPLIGVITSSLYIPTGAVAGGLYMMWPVVAYGLVGKRGAATMTALVQAIISLVSPFGNFGVLSFVIYLAPGLAIDAFLFLTRHKACCMACCFGASAIANIVGTALVGVLVLALPIVPLVFSMILAAISGGLGGIIANTLLVECKKLGL